MKYVYAIFSFVVWAAVMNVQLQAYNPLHVIIINDITPSKLEKMYNVAILFEYNNKSYPNHLATTIKYVEKGDFSPSISKFDVEFGYLDRDDKLLKIDEMIVTVTWVLNNKYCHVRHKIEDPNPNDKFEFKLSDFQESPCTT